jgi:asparagine synthase (glutamine-hydrolysing)
VAAARAGTPIAEIPGDFVAVATGAGGAVTLVTSTVGASPYFWAVGGAGGVRFAHGPNVFDVAQGAGLAWQWNRRAVGFLAVLGHTVGLDSLHEAVERTPPASVVTWDGARVALRTEARTWPGFFDQPKASDLDPAVRVLADVFDEMRAPSSAGPWVSLSAGFDSRLLLALCLRAGIKPRALTMGFDASTDVKVARQIATAMGLEHRVIELVPEDYLRHATAIVHRTSGGKTAAHWHTDLYVRAAGLGPGDVHYVGSNGEFARTFYFDRGAIARTLAVGPARMLEPFLLAKFVRRARQLPPALLDVGPSPRALARHAASLVDGVVHGFGDALDAFYTMQRVRHFIGLGLALYSAHGAPRSPFLDARWLRAIARLPRVERLGCNYHRRAIATFDRRLLFFPVGEDGPMEPRAPFFYHLNKAKAVTYSAFDRVLEDPRVVDILAESRSLDDLVPRAVRIDAARAKSPAVEVLLTLHYAGEIGNAAPVTMPARAPG